ncbi:hypothetical protein OJF2_35140 [Aquisphaera giovannonii]|uniref:DUF4142 domain-containing protein n=1 Tax=Aquisphaera giovannonii TaxID=406548 RepID=A0A5B9W449_9BACT|nr:DUF4142 domain-containing protein [Aquisphaera giovannonii]QEH34969.1 hypothetical protein OJF2_35140 [Aquisphaera giovannonii]
MRQRPSRPRLFDALEDRTLLSVTPPTSVPGGALAPSVLGQSPGSALPTALVQTLQQLSSASNAEWFLSVADTVAGTNANVQNYAGSVVTDDRDSDFVAYKLSQQFNFMLPPGIQPADATTVLQAIAGAGSSGTGTDAAYLNAMVSINQTQISLIQQAMSQTTNPTLTTWLQSQLTSDQSHLAAVQSLIADPGTGVTIPSTPTTGSSSLSSADQNLLQTAYSMSNADKFTAQLTALIDGQTPASSSSSTSTPMAGSAAALSQYGMKLTGDHTIVNHAYETVAFATNTALQPSLPAAAIPNIQALMATLNTSGGQALTNGTVKTSNYETTYLTNNIAMHTDLYNLEASQVANVADPSLKAVIQMDIPSVYLHLQGAQTLLSQIQTSDVTSSRFYHTRAGAYVLGAFESLVSRMPSAAELDRYVRALRSGAGVQRVYVSIARSNSTAATAVQAMGLRGPKLSRYLLNTARASGWA